MNREAERKKNKIQTSFIIHLGVQGVNTLQKKNKNNIKKCMKKKSLEIWKMILKATVNDQATEVADISNKQRIEHFILLIILLCI